MAGFKRIIYIFLAAGLALSLSACASSAEKSASGELFAMDTYMELTVYGDDADEAIAAAEAEINRLDKLLSTGDEESEISKLNAEGASVLSDDAYNIISRALNVYESTDGAFDITVYPLMKLWGFTDQNYAVPDADELSKTLKRVGSGRITLDENTKEIVLGDGQEVDLGGIAKGYTSDRLMEVFSRYDVTSAIVSLGGNVQTYGTKPDGSLWRCAIKNPNDPDSTENFLGVVSVDDKAVITSGAYERYFEEDGYTYHHIIDPETGCPAEAGLISVTIISKSGILADALSTAVYVMGLDKAIAYWREYGTEDADAFDMILMTEEGELYVTENIADSFTSDYDFNVIS